MLNDGGDGSGQPAAPARCHPCISMWARFRSRCVSQSALLIETPHQRGRRLTAPRVAEQFLELVDVDRGKSDQDGQEAVVVRLGEERTRASGEQHVLLGEVADSDGEDAQVGHTRLLRMNAFHPDPGDTFALALVGDGKRDAIIVEACVWER
jgi:hypothetical protein